MSYSKTNWVDGITPLNAANLNKIEDGIATAQLMAENATSSYKGNIITGKTAKISHNSYPALESAKVGDIYTNTSTSHVYVCVRLFSRGIEKFSEWVQIYPVEITTMTFSQVSLLVNNWQEDEGLFLQEVDISDLSESAKIDITSSPRQLSTFFAKGYSFVIENRDSSAIVYSIGNKPDEDITISITITEVSINE